MVIISLAVQADCFLVNVNMQNYDCVEIYCRLEKSRRVKIYFISEE